MGDLPLNNIPSVENALHSLAPGATWSVKYNADGSEYEIEWLSKDIKQPSAAAIAKEVRRLAANWVDESYKQQRADSYPPLSELADALYWQSQGNEAPLLAYYQACNKVKQQFPKPESKTKNGETR